MNRYCIERWEKNKERLEKAIRESSKERMLQWDYIDLAKLVFDMVLVKPQLKGKWDPRCVAEITGDNYQGASLYVFQPDGLASNETDYIVSYACYGSCEVCDTILGIRDLVEKGEKDNAVKEFMALCKDLVTNTVKPFNKGWRYDEDFETIEMKE